MPFVTDGSPLENTPDEAAQTYGQKISPSFGNSVLTGFQQDSLIGSLSGAVERGQYTQSSWFDRALVGMAQANSGLVEDQPKNDPEAYQQLLIKQAQDKAQREDSLERFQNTHSWPVNMASSLASFMLDPLQASSTIVPGLGEDAILGRIGTGFAARTVARLGAGATAGAFSQVPVSLAKAGISSIDDQDYSFRDAARDVFMGAATGALLHTGLGTLGDIYDKTISKVSAPIQHSAMSTAVSQIAEGRPVEVQPILRPNFSPADLEDRETLENQRNLIQRSLETLDKPEDAPYRAQLEQSYKDVQNKLYVTDLRAQEKDILDRVNGNEEELEGNPELADQLSLIRQEIYRTVDQPSDVSMQQQELYAQGYQPATSQNQLLETQNEIRENSQNPQKIRTIDDHLRDVQELEASLNQIPQEHLSEEDLQELNTSKALVDQSQKSEAGYNQASSCLGEAGV